MTLKHVFITVALVISIMIGLDQVSMAREQGAGFIHRNGDRLVSGHDGRVVHLHGVNLMYDRVSSSYCGAGDWRVADHTDWGEPVTCWYQEKHFRLLKEIGFNTVRINLSYRIFEDNNAPGRWKQSGWELIDQLVRWGRKYGIYLILDMHVAPGGAGIIACEGCGYRTWDEPVYQRRLVSLWKSIAARYAEEPQIAAFDLLNEPVPTRNTGQWKQLSQRLIDAIRSMDRNHLLIVEMVQWIFDRNNRSPLEDMDTNTLNDFQFLVRDDQTLYDAHFYIPKTYTLQSERGVNGGDYPDDSVSENAMNGEPMHRNSRFLRHEMETLKHFWEEKDVPVNFGEWGPTSGDGRGGAAYTRDMLALMDGQDIHWQFYSMNRLYRIACCFEDNPTHAVNHGLIDVFRRYFDVH